jgi:hypothetical protein
MVKTISAARYRRVLSYTALKDGSVDLADIARMNDWIDIKADNDARIRKWEKDQE